ncbi:MAG: hypothetical protein JNM31_10025 [Flavobacteriales bacterium]|nr:hypothetical protein [Flavobacteriales bacterium]
MKQALILCSMLWLAACGGGAQGEGEGGKPQPDVMTSEVMRGRISRMEDSIWSRTEFDRRGAMALQSVYLAFVKAHPQDTIAPEYLFRAAGTAKGLRNFEESVRLFDRVIVEYPDWPRLVNAYYMKALTIDDGLKEKGRAQQAYEQVIMRYPDHPFAEQSRGMIELLRYSDAELIEYLKKKNEGSAGAGR